jgi:hypothetical protein
MEGSTEQSAGKRNPWLTHVKKTMKVHKGKSFKAILKLAKKSFTRSKKGGSALSPLPVGGSRRGVRRGTRRGTRKA